MSAVRQLLREALDALLSFARFVYQREPARVAGLAGSVVLWLLLHLGFNLSLADAFAPAAAAWLLAELVRGQVTPTASTALTFAPSLLVSSRPSRLDLLPDPHPTGKRTGAVIRHDERDFTPDRLTPSASDVSRLWQTIRAALCVMLLNDRLGDCTIAALLKLYAILLTIAGQPIPDNLLTDATALEFYEKIDGYRLGVPSTDRGGDLQTVLTYAQKTGVNGVKLGLFASIPTGNLAKIKATLRAKGALYSALDLPDDYAELGFRWVFHRGDPPDASEGHCVVLVMLAGRFFALTWGGVATVSQEFLTTYFVQHFAIDGLAA